MLLDGRGVSGVCRAAVTTRSPAAQSQPALLAPNPRSVGPGDWAGPPTVVAGMSCPREGNICKGGLADSWQQAALSSHYQQVCDVPIKPQVRRYPERRMYQ